MALGLSLPELRQPVGVFPALGTPLAPTLDLDFIANIGYAKGQGRGLIRDLVTISGGAGGTVMGPSGLIVSASAPRFDYDPVSLACKGLLVEEQRTNLLLRSSELDNAVWLKGQPGVTETITANSTAAPDGTLTADTFTALTNGHSIRQSCSVTEGGAYTFTWHAKAGTLATPKYSIYDNTALANIVAPSVYPAGVDAGNGWTRYSVSFTAPVGCTSAAVYPVRDSGGTGTVFIWGEQLEAGAFATSYTPTTDAAVTRTADSVTRAFAASELTFSAEFDIGAVSGTSPILSLDDTTADNQIRLYASGTNLKLTVTAGGVTQADLTLGTVAANTKYRAAFSCRANEFRALLNGGSEQSDTAGTMPTITTLRIGSDVAGNYQNGRNARTRGWTRPLPLHTVLGG